MKLQQTKVFDAWNITHHGEGYLLLNKEKRVEANIVVMPRELLEDWCPAGFDSLCTADMERLRNCGAEIILLGTGPRQRFPAPALLRPLIEARVGFEVMDTAAACRTYNVLMAEGRSVAAALFLA